MQRRVDVIKDVTGRNRCDTSLIADAMTSAHRP